MKHKPATLLSARMCPVNVLSNLEPDLPLLLAALSEDTHLNHISLVMIFVHLPRRDVMLLFRALHISRLSTGCHCCSTQTKHKHASSCTFAEPHNTPQPACHRGCYLQILNLIYPKSKSPGKRPGNLEGPECIQIHPTLRLLERSICEQEILHLLLFYGVGGNT